jgi:hypothetical protein
VYDGKKLALHLLGKAIPDSLAALLRKRAVTAPGLVQVIRQRDVKLLIPFLYPS